MDDYIEARANATEYAIRSFRERLADMPPEQRTSEALIEIAVQLMKIDASIDDLELALGRIGDSVA